MNKRTKMRICDRSLIVTLVLMLASSVQMEATEGEYRTWAWIHIILGVIFLTGVGWHLFEHFRWKNWITMILKQKAVATRWLGIFYALTLVTAIMVLVYWLRVYSHSPLGGWHGKIGFVFLAICIGHTIKRRKSPILKKVKK